MSQTRKMCVGLLLLAVMVASIVQSATITTITPKQGSLLGWTRVSILGTGFDIRGRSNLVYFGTGIAGVYCDPVPNECTATRIVCITAPYEGVGPMPVTVNSFGYNAICQVAAGCTYEYTITQTPQVSSISPQWLIAPQNITVTGQRFSQGDATVAVFDFTMFIGDEERCNLVSTVQWSSFICYVIPMRPGYQAVTVIMGASGMAKIAPVAQNVLVLPSISRVTPSSGSIYGGQLVTIYGSSFSPDLSDNYVTIHNVPCIVNFMAPTYITCKTTAAAQATSSATRLISAVRSYRVDTYYNLLPGYDIDLYWIGTVKYLQPDQSVVVTDDNFAYVSKWANQCELCGFRVTAQFIPTTTGNHTFSLYGDDHFEMWLGLDHEPVPRKQGPSVTGSERTLDIDDFNPRRIISYKGCCTWINTAPQYLVANRSYWLRIFVKNQYGAGSLQARVQIPEGEWKPASDYMYHSEDYVAPVKVIVADTAAVPEPSCFNFSSCDFNFVESSSPTITSVTPSTVAPLATLTIVGTGFDTTTSPPAAGASSCGTSAECGNGGCSCDGEELCTLNSPTCSWSNGACGFAAEPAQCFQWSRNFVTVGGVPCNVTSQTATMLRCTAPFVEAGYQAVDVVVANKGSATPGKSVRVLTTVSGFYPTEGSVNGGNLVTIIGHGFSATRTRVTVGGSACPIQSLTTGVIVCQVPPSASEGAAAVSVLTKNDHTYVLANAYQYDARPVRPGITTEVTVASMTPLSGPASGSTRIFATIPSIYSLSSATDVNVVVGGAPCVLNFRGRNQLQCLTSRVSEIGTFPSWVSFTDKYGQGYSVALPSYAYRHAILSTGLQAVSRFGGAQLYFQLSGAFAVHEVSARFGSVPCSKFSFSGTVGFCVVPPQGPAVTRPVVASFTFLGDGNSLTNPLNFMDYSVGVSVDDNGDAFVPSGGYLMTKRQFTRPFAFKAMIKPSLGSTTDNGNDRSVVTRACVTQATLSSDGYRAASGQSYAGMALYGPANSAGGRNAGEATLVEAALDTSRFQEHRIEVWNYYVRYYVNNVMIYQMPDTSATTGAVGVGFSAQSVTVRSFAVESLSGDTFHVNVSGVPVPLGTNVPDVFYTTSDLPSAQSIIVAASNELSLTGPVNVYTSSVLYALSTSDGSFSADSARVLCPSFYTTTNPVTDAVTYRCSPQLGLGTYTAVLANDIGVGPSAFTVTIALVATSVTPTSVPLSGGRVTIAGSGFSSSVSVRVGTAAATVVTFNSKLMVVDLPAVDTAEGKSLVVTDGGANTVTLAVTYTSDQPITITSVAPLTIRQWSAVTIVGTGFTSATLAYLGSRPMQILSSTSTTLVARVNHNFGSMAGATTLRVVRPGVGIARNSSLIINPILDGAMSPAVIYQTGGGTVSFTAWSFYSFTSMSPSTSLVSNFVDGIASSMYEVHPNTDVGVELTECRGHGLGPFRSETYLTRTYVALPEHNYVRVLVRFLTQSSWNNPGVIVNGVSATAVSFQCDDAAACSAQCVAEAVVIIRHSASSLPVTVASFNGAPFYISTVVVDLYADIPVYVNMSSLIVPVDTISADTVTFTAPSSGLTTGPMTTQVVVDGVNKCRATFCQMTVVDAPAVQAATVAKFSSPQFAPQFVPNKESGFTADYTADGTQVNATVLNILAYSTQNLYAGDGAVLRASATIQSTDKDFVFELHNTLQSLRFGFYSSNQRLYVTHTSGAWYFSGPQYGIGDVMTIEVDARSNTIAWRKNGVRFAALASRIAWPLRLSVQTTGVLSNLRIDGKTVEEERVVFYVANLTQQSSSVFSTNTAWINGTRCRSFFATNGHASCYVPVGRFSAGDVLHALFLTERGRFETLVVLQPHIVASNTSVVGSTGGQALSLTGGLLNTESVISLCASIVRVDGPQLECLTGPSSTVDVAVELSGATNGVDAFTTNSSGLWVAYPSAFDPVLVNVTSGPVVTNVALSGDTMTLTGTGFPDDALVVLSAGRCTVNTRTQTSIDCTIAGVPPGLHNARVVAASRGTSAESYFNVELTLVSASPSVVGETGLAEMRVYGSGFGSDDDGLPVTVTVDDVAICAAIFRLESVLICLTNAMSFDGQLNVTAGSHSVLSSFTVRTDPNAPVPVVSSVTPTSGTGAVVVTITGSGFSADTLIVFNDVSLPCPQVSFVSTTQLTCALDASFPGGHFRVVAINTSSGASVNNVAYDGILSVSRVRPGQGPKMGGQLVTIYGQGFHQVNQTIYLGASPCALASVTSSYVTCYSSALLDEFTTDYSVRITVADDSEASTTASASYSFAQALTAQVTSVTPSTGSAAGMELITISGSGFGDVAAEVSVTLGNSSCRIESITSTQITCRTSATLPAANVPVRVLLANDGAATTTTTFSFLFEITGIVGSSAYSVEGGAVLTLEGSGFWTFSSGDWQSTYYSIKLNGWLECPIISSTPTTISCTLPASPRPRQSTPELSNGYVMRPQQSMGVHLTGNGIAAVVSDNVLVRYTTPATPTITAVTHSGSGGLVFFGTSVTIIGSGFATSNNVVTVNGAECTPSSQASDRIVCTLSAGNFGPGLVKVLAPGAGYASTVRSCEAGMFLNCDGACLSDRMCRFDAWGADTCSGLAAVVLSDTFCHANGGTDSVDKPFLTDASVAFDLNCPMYSCEGNDCNTSLSIGGHGAVVSSCGSDPNGFVADYRSTVTAVSGGPASSLGGGLRITITGTGLPALSEASAFFGGVMCTPISGSSTSIVCETGAAASAVAATVTLYAAGFVARCDSACTGFSYSSTVTPIVTAATFSASNASTITISGSNFVDTAAMSVTVGAFACPVVSVSTSQIVCAPPVAVPAGAQPLVVRYFDYGYATGVSSITVPLTILSFSPTSGSLRGGVRLTVVGVGFSASSTVSIGSSCFATISSINTTTGTILAVTAPCTGSGTVRVRDGSLTATSTTFTQNNANTPSVSGSVDSNTFTLSLSNIGTATASDISIYVDASYASCIIGAISLPSVTCTMEAGYTAGQYNLTVYVHPRGFATLTSAALVATYPLTVTQLDRTSGYRGGFQTITVTGAGFGRTASDLSVMIGATPCTVTSAAGTLLVCTTGRTTVAGTFDVVVRVTPANAVAYAASAAFSSYEYLAASPTITAVNPTRGSTAGGTRLTITGTSLSTSFTVWVAGQLCTQSASEQTATTASSGTTLYCTTPAFQPMYSPEPIRVVPTGTLGDAYNSGAVTYQYIDLWSRWTTWGNTPPPQFGDSAVISEGDVVMIDYSPPRFHLIVVMGTLLFDDTADIFLECTYIMINYGRLTIGTPEKPYTKQATIRLWGNRLTPEIPVHGAKVIALRYGALDMHGIPRHPTWTHVTTTARAGVSAIYVNGPVDWQPGEFIVIAPTDFNPFEGESRMITGVINGDTSNVTLILEAPLEFTHFGERQCFGDGTACIDEIAEVGLLTRNIVVEGEPNSMNIGFGGTMFLMPLGADNNMYARLSYIELRNVGQQFIVGRYPVHYHVTGTIQNSYVNGTSVHHSLNRAYSLHGLSNHTYVNNVAYNVQGHAFFVEDGSERYNVIRNNLVIEVHATTSNLNTDLQPGAIWVAAPMNYIDDNAVAGSQAFGIWIAPFDPYSTGPTFSTSICPFRQALGSCSGNVAHSNEWHGIHIFRFWDPRAQECNANSPSVQAVIRNTVVYKNSIWGATLGNLEVGRVGAIVFDNLTSADNGHLSSDGAAFWIEKITAPNMTNGLQNSLLIAYTNNNPYHRPQRRRGVNLPLGDNFFVENVTFVNFDGENHGFEPQAWAMFKSTCFPYGWEAVTRGLRWVNSPNRILFRFPHHGIINDDDGTLTGLAGSQAVPTSPINQGTGCISLTGMANVFPATACPNNYKLRRFGMATTATPQLDQYWTIDGRTEINPVFMRVYLFTAPINREVLINFTSQGVPDWGWNFGGTTFMQPTERSLFTTYYRQSPYSVYARFDNKATNTTYWGDFPQLGQSASGYAYTNTTPYKASVLLALPDRSVWVTSSQCPPGGCPVDTSNFVWMRKCHHITDGLGWQSETSSLGTDATVATTVHFCLGYNESVSGTAHRTMQAQSVPRTCTNANRVTQYTFTSLTVLGAISMTNEQCPCQGGTVTINIVKFIYIRGGAFLLGNETHPITDCTVKINILDAPWDAPEELATYKNTFYGFRAFTVEAGLFDIHGAKPEPIYTRLSASSGVGATTITLESPVQWAVDDFISIAGTNRQAKYTSMRNRQEHSEYNQIAAISSDRRVLTLRQPLQFPHYGAAPQTLNGRTYRVGAEVAVLSRKIQFTAGESDLTTTPRFAAGWKLNIGCTPGNKDGCTAGRVMTRTNWGLVKVEGVLFRDIGQGGQADGAVNIDGLSDGDGAVNSYFRYNAFWRSFNTAFYVRDTTTRLTLFANVIYDIWMDGIRVESINNNITGNLVMRMGNSDETCSTEGGPYTTFWACRPGMFRIHSGNTVQNNIAASSPGVGFLTDGEPCTAPDTWSNNVAHSTRDGFMTADTIAEPTWKWTTYPTPVGCRRLGGVTTYWSADHGFVAWGPSGNLSLYDFTSVDDQVGTYVMPSHPGQFQTYIPTVWYTNITYANRWNNVDFTCRQGFDNNVACRSNTEGTRPWCRFFTSTNTANNIGNIGAMETVFVSTALGLGETHGEHLTFWEIPDQYSPVGGQAIYDTIHFANYDGMSACGTRNLAFFQNIYSNDTFHLHTFKGVTWSNVAAGGKFFPWKTYGAVPAYPTNVGRTPTYYMDFTNSVFGGLQPDAPNHQLLVDIDGSFTQTGSRKSIVASETLPRTSTFTEIGYDGLAFLGKTLSPARTGCAFDANLNSFVCDATHDWMSLNLDSLADDQLTRRAGPVVICSGDGMIEINGDPKCPGGAIDFASGPVMKGKVQRATFDRLSRWRVYAEDGGNYTLAFRGMPPAWLRLQLQDFEYLGKGTNVGINVNLRYFGANSNNRIGVYVNGVRRVANVGWTDPWNMSPPQPWPNSTMPSGTHYMNLYTDGNIQLPDGSFGFKKNVLYLTIRPGSIVELIQEPIVTVNMAVSMTIDEFFQKKDTFVAALASVLGIDANRIKFSKIVAGTTRRRSGGSVQLEVQIDSAATTTPTSGSSSGGTGSAPVGGSVTTSSPELSSLVTQLNQIALNTSVIAAAANDSSFVITGLTAVQVTVAVQRPTVTIAEGTPYLALNVSDATNSSAFNSATVSALIASWVEANFSISPYNTTSTDGTMALGNVWTDSTTNVTQFTVTFAYSNNTHSMAALLAIHSSLMTGNVLPGYTIHTHSLFSNGYVADVATPPAPPAAPPASLATPENITKFAIGIAIGVAIVMVVGGLLLFHILVVYPKLKLQKINKEKLQLKEFIEKQGSQGKQANAGLNDDDPARMFPLQANMNVTA